MLVPVSGVIRDRKKIVTGAGTYAYFFASPVHPAHEIYALAKPEPIRFTPFHRSLRHTMAEPMGKRQLAITAGNADFAPGNPRSYAWEQLREHSGGIVSTFMMFAVTDQRSLDRFRGAFEDRQSLLSFVKREVDDYLFETMHFDHEYALGKIDENTYHGMVSDTFDQYRRRFGQLSLDLAQLTLSRLSETLERLRTL